VDRKWATTTSVINDEELQKKIPQTLPRGDDNFNQYMDHAMQRLELALKLKPLVHKKAKERQSLSQGKGQ
jgi:hypothetical protein